MFQTNYAPAFPYGTVNCPTQLEVYSARYSELDYQTQTYRTKPSSWQCYTDGGRSILVPFWVLGLPIAGMAIAPWRSWSGRFSLRTLLIATTLVAVVLGLAAWTIP